MLFGTWKKILIIAVCASVVIAGVTVGILYATGAFDKPTTPCAPEGKDPYDPKYGKTGNCCECLVRMLDGEKYVCKKEGEKFCATEGEEPNVGGKSDCCADLNKVLEGGKYVCKKQGEEKKGVLEVVVGQTETLA